MKKALLIDNGSTLVSKLAKLIPLEQETYSWDEIPENWESYDLIVLSGSSSFPLAGNEAKLAREIQLIQTATKPIIGICFGHELIAHAYGLQVVPMQHKHVGITNIAVTQQHTMFNDKELFSIYENHSFGVTKTHSPMRTLATSDHAIAVMKHQEKPIYGLQFHPEHHTNKQYGDEVFLRLVSHLLD